MHFELFARARGVVKFHLNMIWGVDDAIALVICTTVTPLYAYTQIYISMVKLSALQQYYSVLARE